MQRYLCSLLIFAGMGVLAPGFGQGRVHGSAAHRPVPPSQSGTLTGTYTRLKRRKDENQSAELTVKQISAHHIKFNLTALWWSAAGRDSPHNGEIEATVALHHQVAVYKTENYRLTLRFRDHSVVLTESGNNDDFGMNVSAAGTYQRARLDRKP